MEKFLASEEYGDKISFKCSFQTLEIKYFYLICFWSQRSIKIQYKNSGKKMKIKPNQVPEQITLNILFMFL